MQTPFDYHFTYGFQPQQEFDDKYPGLISIDEATSICASVVGGIEDRDYAYMRQWIYMACSKLGVSNSYEVSYKVTASDYFIPKPVNAIKVKSLRLYTEDDNEIPYNYYSPGADRAIFDMAGHIIVSSTPKGFSLDITHGMSDSIFYGVMDVDSLPIDDDGDIMIEDQDMDAIVIYVKYMLALRENSPNMERLNKMFIMKRKDRRAKKNMPTPMEAVSIAKTMSSMIQKFNPSRFTGEGRFGPPSKEKKPPKGVTPVEPEPPTNAGGDGIGDAIIEDTFIVG